MKDVSGALKINPLKYKDRAVKSIPKRVTNVSEHLAKPMSLDKFSQLIMDHIIETHNDCELYEFTQADIEVINKFCYFVCICLVQHSWLIVLYIFSREIGASGALPGLIGSGLRS